MKKLKDNVQQGAENITAPLRYDNSKFLIYEELEIAFFNKSEVQECHLDSLLYLQQYRDVSSPNSCD